MKKNLLPLFIFGIVFNSYSAETLQEIELKVRKEEALKSLATSDSSQLLNKTPGISFQSGGGITSLPVIQGLGDDRVKIKIDGATITSSCSNHMNPALSYIDPDKVSRIEVMAGITPVSQGGDSLGGSITVQSKEPRFSSSDNLLQKLRLKTYLRTNNENQGSVLDYDLATKDLSLGYSGMDERANNYRVGGGQRLKGTLYNQNNQMVTLGKKLEMGVVSLKLGRTNIPYQGFTNQYMDLEDNVANLINIGFRGELEDVQIETSLFYQHTNHYMNKLNSERPGNMPMYTRSDEMGLNFKGEVELSKKTNLIFGTEAAFYRLDDWWPPVTTTLSGMGPGTFESINNGKRDRLAFFAEIDTSWSPRLMTNMGLRTDLVSMNAGDVIGYNDVSNSPSDAGAFNSRNHQKFDKNFDSTLSGKYSVSPVMDVELGIARKSRSPNLYERYAWAGSVSAPSGPVAMDMRMINWFGDGNGYVGNLDLRPEVAHKASASFIFHDDAEKKWELKISPFYSEIEDFIDADLLGQFNNRNYLKFQNHDAIIFGADIAFEGRILERQKWGDLLLRVIGSYTRGYRKDKAADLYHLMPLNGKVFFEHRLGKWVNELSVYLVDKKSTVNGIRLENKTPGYATFDFGTSYQMSKSLKVDLGITNILDHHYLLPLGGVDIVNSPNGKFNSLAGVGRSYNAALTIDFL